MSKGEHKSKSLLQTLVENLHRKNSFFFSFFISMQGRASDLSCLLLPTAKQYNKFLIKGQKSYKLIKIRFFIKVIRYTHGLRSKLQNSSTRAASSLLIQTYCKFHIKKTRLSRKPETLR